MSTTIGSPGTGSSESGSSGEVGSDTAERAIRSNSAVIAFARVGWVAKGVVYGLVGVLALAIVFGSQGGSGSGGSGEEASQSGALAKIAVSPAGTALLYVLAVGLGIYALWRLFTVIMPADNDAESWLTRAGYLVSFIVYSVLAWTAIQIAMSGGSSSQQQSEDAKVERWTRDFLEMTGGRAIVFTAGAALIIIGAAFLYKAYSAKFEKQLEHRGVGPISYRVMVILGRIGWVGRAGMMALIGFFLCRAAWQYNPDEAKGLDGSLRQAAGSTGGTILVIVVGAGLVVYGAFCVISAPRRRLVPADES